MIDIFWRLFEISFAALQSLIVMRFVCLFFNYNFNSLNNKVVYIASSVLHTILILIFNRVMLYEGILGVIAYALYYFIFSLIFLRGKVIEKIFLSIGTIICLIGASSIVASIISVIVYEGFTEVYTTKGIPRFIGVILVQILLLYFYELILKITRKDKVGMKSPEWALVLVVFILSLVIFGTIHAILLDDDLNWKFHYSLFFAELGIIFINIFCFYMVIRLSKSNKTALEFELFKQEQEYKEQNTENIKRQYEEIRYLKHNMRHNYSAIGALARDGRSSELLDYLCEVSAELSAFETLINTESSVVNAIMSQKIDYAKSKGIKVIFSCANNFDGFEDNDLCSLLGNLLENACDACLKCEEGNRYIDISIKRDNELLTINVCNSIPKSVLTENLDLQTTKADKGNHGLGVKSVKRIAEKYNGRFDYYEEDNLFCCKVLLFCEV
ncbi:MAG: GHKL domain-containing protein [Oscillospiraceae bacterium]|nr:GHKL domain-containing protein [Oscillospiraceae bacterium]